ncbi:sugar ABC transporter permease [Pseudarthrobacter sp. J64]|uniref:carbohydrate ABC transporter permease n=1 Tax=Pseudarthrobacter sp. J64 TaxID=3116485 RepID=UPI002E811C75|nr:sugar ABC transporter permease [Pseudarthrobacter sp. J64]MEE2568911.1 sugar ABC transporter permease [Pseudarthrobacter sp. J64]
MITERAVSLGERIPPQTTQGVPEARQVTAPVEGADRSARRTNQRRRRQRLTAVACLAPAFVFYLSFVVGPWIQSVWISLFDWDGIGASTWVGLDNYLEVFTDAALRSSILNAFGFILFYTVLPLIFGLALAALTAGSRGRGLGIVRTILFLPQILPLVAVGVIFKWIYSPDGPLNQVLHAMGAGGLARGWLGDFNWAYPSVGLVGTWVTTGLCFLLFLSGIGKIDASLFEAARLDGANRLQEFWHITVPGVRGEIGVAVTVTVIAALASFDVVYVMTGGGPGYTTMVPGVQVYQLVFSDNRVGAASALSVVLSVIVVGIVGTVNAMIRRSK